MSYSDDTIAHDFYGSSPNVFRIPGQTYLIVTQYCETLDREEKDNQRHRLERQGWKNVRVRERKDGDWTEYQWLGNK